ncbi:MAG: hypothetical protein ABSC77_15065 [Terracidiphilus sp.]|jgi:hypothetical protein
MNKTSRRITVTVALLTMMAAGSNLAKAQKAVKPNNQPPPSSATTAQPNVAQLQSTADEAAARIQASPSDKSALISVVRTKNVDRASDLLLQNGFTSKQLEGAKFEFVDKTGGAGGAGGAGGGNGGTASKVKVTIRVDCCPLVITITIYL